MSSLRVLIVDDEAPILQSTQLLLEGLGHEVHTCGAARDVRETAERLRPDVILQDVRMPGLVIDEHVPMLRGSPGLAGTRIILFSAGMDLDEVGSRLSVDGVLEKPFKPQELMQALEAPAAAVAQ